MLREIGACLVIGMVAATYGVRAAVRAAAVSRTRPTAHAGDGHVKAGLVNRRDDRHEGDGAGR